jgi:hypothetical protein
MAIFFEFEAVARELGNEEKFRLPSIYLLSEEE